MRSKAMSQRSVEKLISLLKGLEVEESKLKESRASQLQLLRHLEDQLDKVSLKRSNLLNELELSYKKKLLSLRNNDNNNDNNGSNRLQTPSPGFGVEIESDAITAKRKTISRDASSSDLEIKKAKPSSRSVSPNRPHVDVSICLNNVDPKSLNPEKASEQIDEIADRAIREFSNPDHNLKRALKELSSEPDFASLVEDIEIDTMLNNADLDGDSIAELSYLNEQSSPISALLSKSFASISCGQSSSPNRSVRQYEVPEPSRIPRPLLENFVSKLLNIKSRINGSPERSQSQPSIKLSPSDSPVPTAVVSAKVREKSASSGSLDGKKQKETVSPPVEAKSKCFKELSQLWEKRANDDLEKKLRRAKPKPKNGERFRFSDF